LAISSFRCATIASAPETRASASRRAFCSAGEGRAKGFGIGGNRIDHGHDLTTIASRWVQEIRLIYDEFNPWLPAAMY
jgi:hypothetical protein